MELTERALDALARRVMLDAAWREYGDLMEELPEHTFSPAFERKMKKLVRRGNHPLRHRILRAAAYLLLALLLCPGAQNGGLGGIRRLGKRGV